MSSQEQTDYSKEPTTTARVEYDEATKQQALERAKLPETIPDDKILQQRQLEASYSRLGVGVPTVDELANIIRTVDGQNMLGAGALAEAILAALTTEASQ